MLFDENLSFEIHAVPQFHELVGITRVAVLAGKLAASIRIDGPRERKIASAYHPAEQRSRAEGKVFNVVSLAKGFARSCKARDAHEFRRGTGFPEERRRVHRAYSLFVRLL